MILDNMLYAAVIMIYGILCFMGYIMWKLLQSIIKDIQEIEEETEEFNDHE